MPEGVGREVSCIAEEADEDILARDLQTENVSISRLHSFWIGGVLHEKGSH